MFSSAHIDLDGYFQRIGFTGERTSTTDVLKAILRLHPQAIPFENLNPLLGWPVHLDAQTLQQKLVDEFRGGYCFEHNLLLGHVLTTLGFRVTGLAARVMLNAPPDFVGPRTHMVLLVDVDGSPHIADVGFGGLTLTGLLRLETGTEQATPHGPFRLIQEENAIRMEARLPGAWTSLYRFDLQACAPVDYEVANWYVSTCPRSHFTTSLTVARVQVDGRAALRNHELSVYKLGGEIERRRLTSVREVRDALTDMFGIRVPGGAHVDKVFARIVGSI